MSLIVVQYSDVMTTKLLYDQVRNGNAMGSVKTRAAATPC